MMARAVAILALGGVGASCGLIVASCSYQAWDYRLSLSQDFHVGLINRRAYHWHPIHERLLDPRVTFFNDANYGPYCGSIIGLEGDEFPKAVSFGDRWGIYYRYFWWGDGSTLWTLSVSIWHLLNVSVLVGIGAVIQARHRRFSIGTMLLSVTVVAITYYTFEIARAPHPLSFTVALLAVGVSLAMKVGFQRIRSSVRAAEEYE